LGGERSRPAGIGAAVLALRDPYRSAILLRFCEDVAPSAIAERLGIPVETVKTRL
jgi:DNA-directed RNA polymerase specialized sigma24 family protein